MNIKKTVLGSLERAYASCIMEINDQLHYIIASEGVNECRAINAKTHEETVIWDSPGGVMNIIPVPGRKNQFIATRKFLPTFDSAECEIVHAIVDENNNWAVTPIMKIPYLHRFDLILIEEELHLIGGVLCNSKAYKEDWSDPGKVIIGKFHKDITQAFELQSIYDGITKNHGFWSGQWNGKQAFFITGVEGLFVTYVPLKLKEEWIVEQIMDHEISDCAIYDIDGDGKSEIATIESFHGNKGKIYKEINGKWQVIHEHDYEFGHVVWGGILAGKPPHIIKYIL